MHRFQSILEILTQKSGQQNVLLYRLIHRDLPVGNVITFYVPYLIRCYTAHSNNSGIAYSNKLRQISYDKASLIFFILFTVNI